MNLFKSSIYTFLTKILMFSVGIISSVLVVRLVGAEGKGILSVIQTFFGLLVAFSYLSLNSGLVFYVSKSQNKNSFYNSALVFSFFESLLLIVVVFLFKNQIADFFFEAMPIFYLYIGFFLIITNTFQKVTQSICRAKKNISVYNISFLLQQFIYVGLIILIWLFIDETKPSHIFGAILIPQFISIVYVLVVFKNDFNLGQSNFDDIKKMSFFGIREHIGAISHKLNLRLDILIMGSLLTAAEIGYYSIAVIFAQLVWYIPDSIGTFLYPQIAGLNNKESSANTAAKVNRISIVIVLMISLAIYFACQYLIPFMYGSDFIISIDIVKILLLGTVGLSVQKILTKYFSGIGKPIITSWSAIVGLAINIPLLIILIPEQGIIGAAIATSISYLSMGFFSIILFIKESKKSLSSVLFIRASDIEGVYKKIKNKIKLTE